LKAIRIKKKKKKNHVHSMSWTSPEINDAVIHKIYKKNLNW
jgi:hypothetical protein